MTLEDTLIEMLLDNANLLFVQAERITNALDEDYTDYFASLDVISMLTTKLQEELDKNNG